jgi:hypothetical protein
MVRWTSRWDDAGTPVNGDETNRTLIGEVNFDPDLVVTINGRAFTAYGGLATTGTEKVVTRTGLSASVSIGAPADPQATFAYGFRGNRFLKIAAEVDAMGPLGAVKPGTPLGVGGLVPTGGVGGYVSTPARDATSYTVFVPRVSYSVGPAYKWGGLSFEFDGSTGATIGAAERGTLGVSGSNVTQSYLQRTFVEGGTESTAAGTRSGSYTVNPNFTVDFTINGAIWGGIGVGDADMFILVPFGNDTRTGIQVLTKNATAQPPVYDYGLTQFSKTFVDMNLPARTGLSLQSGTFTPARNLIAYATLDQNRYNDTPGVSLGRQFNTGTATTDANGGLSMSLGNATHTGGSTPDGCAFYSQPGASDDEPPTMLFSFGFSF